jgi:hypothetical protein
MVSSFPEKKQKRLFCFAEGYTTHISAKPTLGACPQQNTTVSGFLLFQKRSKSVCSASQKIRSRRSRPWGMPPAKPYIMWFLLFQKRSKSVSSASQKVTLPRSRRSRPWGSGGMPPAKHYVKWFLLFQKGSKHWSLGPGPGESLRGAFHKSRDHSALALACMYQGRWGCNL